MSIARINEFVAAEGKADELFAFLRSILDLFRGSLKSLIPYLSSSNGCELCEVLQSTDDKNNFVVLEKWESIEFHKKSIENYPKEEMQSAMVLFGTPPNGCFYHA